MAASFELERVYAFTVSPQRGAQQTVAGEGGVVRTTDELRRVVAVAGAKISRSTLSRVDLNFDAARSHPVREDVLSIAFGGTVAPRAGAARLAVRLSSVMDNRSHEGLLVTIVEANADTRRVGMLLFPREDAIQLGGGKRDEEVVLKLLQNAFSMGSGVRKFARLDGRNNKSGFLSAEILDLQLASANRSVADFWVTAFLDARFAVNPESGSKQLGAALLRAFEAAPLVDKDEVFAAMVRVRSGHVRRTSIESYGKELPQSALSAYVDSVSGELRTAVFDVRADILQQQLGRRIFEMQDGIILSAPTGAAEKVEISETRNQRIASYRGVIKNERVRGEKRVSIQRAAEKVVRSRKK